MEWRRITSKSDRVLGTLFLAAGLTCLLMPGTSAAFGNSSLAGGYGCLGQGTTGTSSGLSEVMRLAFDGAGHVHGKIVLNLSGEVCNVVVTGGTYSINSVGIGTIALPWTSATGDADGDTNCSTLFGGQAVTEHLSLVLERNAAIFDFQADDDFLTSPTSPGDTGDLQIPFTDSCKNQS
jgi:hypothetical protein